MSLIPVYLGLGSNVERERHLHAGLDALAGFLHDLRCSPVFESEPVGIKSGPFFNLVVSARTDLPLAELSLRLKHIEADNGRYAPERKGCRWISTCCSTATWWAISMAWCCRAPKC